MVSISSSIKMHAKVSLVIIWISLGSLCWEESGDGGCLLFIKSNYGTLLPVKE